ncbi:hypothetical protein DFH27DRAFT_577900 [Peziza echinospora]|nr:hypothetical protein DFH27DRAFT_577900 [Peziza echinospora]
MSMLDSVPPPSIKALDSLMANNETPPPETEQKDDNIVAPGDLIFLHCPTDTTRQKMFVVVSGTDISSGTVLVADAVFGVGDQEADHRWTLDGEHCYYQGDVNEYITHEREVYSRENPRTPGHMRVELPAPFPLPLAKSPEETLVVRPGGILIREEYFFGDCMFCDGSGTFCPGCGGVWLSFPYLFMSCGELLACPVCHGQSFARTDKGMLQYMEYHCKPDSEEFAQAWEDRCAMVNERREELGLPAMEWEEPEEEEEEGKEGEGGKEDEGGKEEDVEV